MAKTSAGNLMRKSFNLDDKKRIIDRVRVAKATGGSMRSVARELDISWSTLTTILSKEDEIMKRLKDNPSSEAKV